MIHSNLYQLATPATYTDQASLEPQIPFPPLDKGHQEISCRAAVHKESAETIRLFSAWLAVVKSALPKSLPN